MITKTTEPLTDAMIHALAREAGRHADVMQCYICEIALGHHVADVDDVRAGMPKSKADARAECAAAINEIRRIGGSETFVRVVV